MKAGRGDEATISIGDGDHYEHSRGNARRELDGATGGRSVRDARHAGADPLLVIGPDASWEPRAQYAADVADRKSVG